MIPQFLKGEGVTWSTCNVDITQRKSNWCIGREVCHYLYYFVLKLKYGSWIYKIRQIYESPMDHSFCFENPRDSFCIWKRRWNYSKKISEQVIWPILKNFQLVRGCVLSFRIWAIFQPTFKSQVLHLNFYCIKIILI